MIAEVLKGYYTDVLLLENSNSNSASHQATQPHPVVDHFPITARPVVFSFLLNHSQSHLTHCRKVSLSFSVTHAVRPFFLFPQLSHSDMIFPAA